MPFGPEGPGNRFNYSSGNAVIMMRAMKAIYGAEYESMPWRLLFDPLGIKHATFERDRTGTFVGGSYVRMPLRDIARFGWAYLNGGYYGGQQVIQPAFVDTAMQLSSAMRASGTKDSDILDEEGFYSLGFWINPTPASLTAKGLRSFGPTFPKTKFFPNVTSDVFMALGHYGQNILIFPKDDLLIVRVSHDKEYWSKLDHMTSAGRACFNEVEP
jgi:CubicO group peptidase (beta-lactamase class C family)